MARSLAGSSACPLECYKVFMNALGFPAGRAFSRLAARRCLRAAAAALALCLPFAAPAQQGGDRVIGPREADKLLVVDCMLPGQVRRLGMNMTYLSARRPAKLSADECSLRGGEYVAYDRASLDNVLAAWLPAAKQGDAAAQTFVGEIYERGIGGVTPSYAESAGWYRKAAEQGYSRAMVNLGFLYEKGLGVTRDPAQALNLYRKASGLEGAIALEGDAAARDEQVRKLQTELEATRQQLDKAQKELERLKKESGAERGQLERRIREAQSAGDNAAVAKLKEALRQRDAELEARSREVGDLTASLSATRKQLQSLQSETASLRDQLELARKDLQTHEDELAVRRMRADEDARRIDSLKAELSGKRADGDAKAAENVRRLEAQLKLREEEFARQKSEIARVEAEAKQYKERLIALEAKQKDKPRDAGTARATKDFVAIAPPTIELIDPPMVLTRSQATIKVRGNLKQRELVGRVTAPAGLLAFTVNDLGVETEGNGLFRVQVTLKGAQTPVNLVAVDRQGKRAALDFILQAEPGAEGAVTATIAPYLSRVEFGRYHALVIGNQAYKQLPRLDTAIEDAKAVADVLTNKYGFKVTLLQNATRYEILSALNKLRAQLTEKDNLLIYYAGHGEIDKANQRGYWLPIDAEPNSDANWISNVSITDLLSALSVKHALVVADSCYSGTLTRSSIGQLESGMSDDAREKWLRAMVKARARTVLTSGGLQPVLDGGGGKHSVFAKFFLEVLQANNDALEAQRLYREVAARVLDVASRYRLEQRPEYAPLKFAGHESGDFLFVPMMTTASR